MEDEQPKDWETETVFGGKRKTRTRRIAAGAGSAVIAATIAALLWPAVRERVLHPGILTSQSNPTTTTEQGPGRSDILPPEDTIQSEQTNPGAQDGVFVFSEPEKQGESPAKTTGAQNGETRATLTGPNAPTATAPNPLDAQLMAEKNDLQTTKKPSGKDDANCKPDSTTATLMRSETPIVNTAQTTQSTRQDNGRSYILGPRGGCFYVTAGGSKKYVDRGLCGSLGAISARP